MTTVASGVDMPTGGFAFSVTGGIDACSEARRVVIAADGAVPEFARSDIVLLVSELVTNAVRHGDLGPDESVRVTFERWPRRVRVAVSHSGTAFEHEPVPRAPDAIGGWGLLLVDRIADRWGIASTRGGTCVWFELRSEP